MQPNEYWQPPLPDIRRRRVVAWPAVVDAFLSAYRGHTLENYRRDLTRWAEWCARQPLEPLSAERADVQRYVAELQDAGRKPSTVAVAMAAIAGAYKWAAAEDVIPRNPAEHVRRPKVNKRAPRRWLDRHELQLLLYAAHNAGTLPLALVLLLGLDGLRVSEACGVDITDLATMDGHRVLYVVGKGDKERLAPLAPLTASAVDAHIGRRARGPLLEHHGGRLNRGTAWRIVRELGTAAGIPPPGISPHSLRRSFATLAKQLGVELQDVQDAMGHADPRTTQLYDQDRKRIANHPTFVIAALFDLQAPAATQDVLCRGDGHDEAGQNNGDG